MKDTDKIEKLVDSMEPEETASVLSIVLRKIFPLLKEDTRLSLVSNLVGASTDEKVSSLVHL
jgi:hypothetical protein